MLNVSRETKRLTELTVSLFSFIDYFFISLALPSHHVLLLGLLIRQQL